MIFTETKLAGAFLIEPELIHDDRGFFAVLWSEAEFRANGLNPRVVQSNSSYNKLKGTLRGMHFQINPHEEAKLVRCTAGAIFDVIVDLRKDSRTFREWIGFELSAKNRHLLYVPEGFAHGYQTLADDSEISYQISESYHPESARGVRWNDPAFGIEWPEQVTVIAERDDSYPDFVEHT